MCRTLFFILAFLIVNFDTELFAQTSYKLPPQEVVDIVDAPSAPSVRFSPDHKWMLMLERDSMPSIADISRRMLQLAGMRIDPVANSRFATSFAKGVRLKGVSDGKDITIPIPKDGKLSGASWSHTSKAFTLTIVTESGTQLWVCTVADPTKPRMLTDRLSTVMTGYSWTPNGDHILCQLVPKDRGEEPEKTRVPLGPNVQESIGKKSPTRTYQDLLSNAYDESLFKYYATTQMALVSIDGTTTELGKPAIFAQSSLAPDGKHVLATTIRTPFSYLMTYRSFPQSIQVWNIESGTAELVKELAEIPMAENIPIEGVRTGIRNVDWKSNEPATLIWAEALDGGDPNKAADFRDKIVALSQPFTQTPREVVKLQFRSMGVMDMATPASFITREYDRDRRWLTSKLHDLSKPGISPKVIEDRSVRDRYADPGGLVMETNEFGHQVIKQEGDWVYRSGSGASPKGNFPFFDRQNLRSLKTERLWRCEEGAYESAVDVAGKGADGKPSIITRRETPTTPANYLVRDLGSGASNKLTEFSDPTPQIRKITKKLVRYKRADGVPLSATLYLPADYKEGTRLPLMVWAYPREFNDVKTASQISGSPNRFTTIRSISHLTLLTQGYAVMDAATMPVIGDPKTMNDTFVEQIVSAAQAAIDKAVDLGVADRNRVAVGGHSYGAFMTANLLAHCDLFKAGIARSGAYNRTLTPFGFQSERRAFWEAKDVYFSVSPFMHADKIKDPILLIHGENDNNSGTFPIQSKRMYQAVKGNGGTVRLVMLPNESHGYRGRESVLHTQAEMIQWLDKYVKNAKE